MWSLLLDFDDNNSGLTCQMPSNLSAALLDGGCNSVAQAVTVAGEAFLKLVLEVTAASSESLHAVVEPAAAASGNISERISLASRQAFGEPKILARAVHRSSCLGKHSHVAPMEVLD